MSAPVWLVGGDAALAVAVEGPMVWLVDLAEPAARERAEALALLPGEAAAVAGRRDAGERLLRWRLARMLLAEAGGCRADEVVLGRSDRGAPRVDRPSDWHLSLAARWPLCAIGVAREPIGVDIEIAGEPLPADLLTSAERLHTPVTPALSRGPAALPGPRRSGTPGQARGDEGGWVAARRWAAKEAHAKWTDRPRDLDPAAIETGPPLRHPGFVPGSTVPPTSSADPLAARWMPGQARHDEEGIVVTSRFGVSRCWLRDLGGHVAAVCVR